MPKHKKMNAKELTKKRVEVRDLLISHDVSGFRAFVLKHGNLLLEAAVCAQYLKLDNEGLSILMHQIKARQPYLGDAFQQSRNVFRQESLEAALQDPSIPKNEALLEELKNQRAPLCAHCVYFRKGSVEGEAPCMRRGALPGDIACAGWTRAS